MWRFYPWCLVIGLLIFSIVSANFTTRMALNRVFLMQGTPAETHDCLLPFSGGFGEDKMKQEDEMVLKVTKEIVVKFIEMGRLSLSSFDDAFRQIHKTVHDSVTRKPSEE